MNNMPNLSSLQLDYLRNRLTAYCDLSLAIATTSDILNGHAVADQALREAVKEKLIDGGKAENIWDVYHSIHDIASDKANDADTFFKESIFDEKTGVKYERANVAVEFNGKILNAEVDREVENHNHIRIKLASYELSSEGVLESIPFNTKHISITRDGDALSANLTYGMTPEFIAKHFGSPDYKLEVARNIHSPHKYQTEVLQKLVGVKKEGVKYVVEQNKISSAQLITAGTGTGKTAVLAGYAKAMGSGIIAVPESLVSDMVRDSAGFVGQKPSIFSNEEFSAIISSPLRLEDTLKRHPYIVLSHEQLLAAAPLLKNQIILADEGHELTMGRENANKTNALKKILDNNRTIVVTATPTAELYNLVGNEVVDIPLYMAQNKIKSVRCVDTQDVVVGTKGQNNIEAIVKETLYQMLGRKAEASATNKSHIDKSAIKEQEIVGDTANKIAACRNIVLAIKSQGIVFSDNPVISERLLQEIEALSPGRQTPALLAVQERIAHESGGQFVDIRTELVSAHKRNIANAINTVAMHELNPNLNLKKLQRLARNDSSFSDEQTAITNALQKMGDEKAASNIESIKEKYTNLAENPNMAGFYELVIFATQRISKKDGLIKPEEIDLEKICAKTAIRLPKNADIPEIENAKLMLNSGIAQQLISDGPLGTGYSNTNILSTVITETCAYQPGDAMKRVQMLGRSIRAHDLVAMGSIVSDTNLAQNDRNPITAAIAVGAEGYKATKLYRETIMKREANIIPDGLNWVDRCQHQAKQRSTSLA